MHIGIDAHVLGGSKGGVERHVQNLITWLPRVAPEHQYLIFCRKSYRPPADYPTQVCYMPLPVADPLIQRSLILPLLVRRHRLDLLHVQRIAPPFPGCPVLVSIHDLLPVLNPEEHRGLRNQLVRLLTPYSVRCAAKIITVSEVVKAQIAATYDVLPERIVTAYNGIDHDFFKLPPARPSSSAYGEERVGPRLLCLGALEPRKNLETVLRAIARLRTDSGIRARLVFAGGERAPGYARALRRLAVELGIEGLVELTGYVDDRACLELFWQTDIFLAPSTSEGFGIPPLEAMACGVPVISSDIEVFREIFNGCARFFAPDSPEDLARSIEFLWNNRGDRETQRLSGLRKAGEFTWEKMACQIAQAYNALATVTQA